jgi:carbon monoxide dehydrogenase subunit G
VAVQVSVPFTGSFELPVPKEKAFAYLQNYEVAIAKAFPGVEKLEAKGNDTYRWQFEKFTYGGYEFTIGFSTRFRADGDSLVMEPAPDGSKHQLSGRWKLESAGSGTKVHFEASLLLELPIPFFLKGMATSVTQKEITGLFRRYVERAPKHCPA